jgi:hypothetical protein
MFHVASEYLHVIIHVNPRCGMTVMLNLHMEDGLGSMYQSAISPFFRHLAIIQLFSTILTYFSRISFCHVTPATITGYWRTPRDCNGAGTYGNERFLRQATHR